MVELQFVQIMAVTRVRRGTARGSVQIVGDSRAPLGLHVSATAESAAHPLPLALGHVLNSDHGCKQSRPEVDSRLTPPCAHPASASWRARPSCHASAHQGGLRLSTRTSSPLAGTPRKAPTQQSLCGPEAANTPSVCVRHARTPYPNPARSPGPPPRPSMRALPLQSCTSRWYSSPDSAPATSLGQWTAMHCSGLGA